MPWNKGEKHSEETKMKISNALQGKFTIDMVGFKSGLLTVIGKAPTQKNKKRAYWLCQCECGNIHIVMGKYLRRGEVKSCGCLNRTPIDGAPIKHGYTAKNRLNGKWDPTYVTWSGMIQRCTNPNNTTYPRYGGKGINVCEHWLKFENFLKDMGGRPHGKTIDRIDNSKGYEPGNCRWATAKEQAQNQTKNRLITLNGETHCLGTWAEKIGITSSTLLNRIKKWPIEKALTAKVK